jgi:hypothetical protein
MGPWTTLWEPVMKEGVWVKYTVGDICCTNKHSPNTGSEQCQHSVLPQLLSIYKQSTSHLLDAWTEPIYLIQCTLSWCEMSGSWHALLSPVGQKTWTHMSPTNKHKHLQHTHHVFCVSKCVDLFCMYIYFLCGSAVPMMSCYCTYNKCAALLSGICILSRYLTWTLRLEPTRKHILNYEYYCLVWHYIM